MKNILQEYANGWIALLKGCAFATIWMMVVVLPFYAFLLLFPDQMEGKVEGARWIRPASTIIMLIWAPIAAGALGPLRFSKRKKNE
jgi:hypothetical protein